MWILPSRERPNEFKRLLDACRETCTSNSTWYVRLDLDDPRLGEYLSLDLPENWKRKVGPRKGPCETAAEAFSAFPNEPFYGLIADDVVPKTKGWDSILENEAGTKYLAFGNDLHNEERLATHPCIGGDLVRALGWLILPGVKRIYADTALTQIARETGRLKYLPDVITEHLHFSLGKSPYDAVYAKPGCARDREIFQAWIKTQMKDDAERINRCLM